MLWQRYLLVVNIPLHVWEGKRFADRLWLIDLRRHLAYLPNLTLLCPVATRAPTEGMEPLSSHQLEDLRIIAMPDPGSTLAALATGLFSFHKIWKAVGTSDIVHGSPIGWPIPLGYWAFLAARLRHQFFIAVIESAPWRLHAAGSRTVAKRLRAQVMERMARWVCSKAQLALFTTEAYRRSLVPDTMHNAHVFKAVWLPKERIVPIGQLRARWQARASEAPLVVGFAGRLVPDKGILVLIDALDLLDDASRVTVRILGDGPLRQDIAQRNTQRRSTVSVQLLGTLQYGQDFDREIDGWDLAVIPSLSGEQPRLVFDCFGRGVPVLVSDTPGLAECVEDGVTGFHVPRGAPDALARQLMRLAADRKALMAAACAALDKAPEFTHERMHLEREGIIDASWRNRAPSR